MKTGWSRYYLYASYAAITTGFLVAFLLAPAAVSSVRAVLFVVCLLLVVFQGMLVFRNIRKLEADLARHQEAERMVHLGHWYWDIPTGDVTWSDEVYHIFRLDPETFVPQIDSIMSLSPWPDENKRDQEVIERAMKSRQTGAFEQRFLFPDGETGYYFSSFHGVYNADGTVRAVRGTVQDITERKKFAIQLSTIHQAIDNSLNAFDIIDEDGKFVYVNKAYVRMWGYESAEEILGTSPANHCADVNTPREIVHELKNTGECIREFTARRKDGSEFDVLMYARLDHDYQDREIYPTTAIDISERKRTESELSDYRNHLETLVKERTQALEMAQAELLKRERMEALGQLIATVSHELRNPLGTIRASLYVITERTRNKEIDVLRPIERADRSIERCVRIIDELLDYTRTRVLSRQITEMGTWLSATLEGFLIPEGIEVERDFASDIKICLDQVNVQRCLSNIWKNACDALLDDHGCHVGGGRARLAVSSRVEGDFFVIASRDNGCGIRDEDRDHLFEPLFSTKGFGVGLGLNMAADILSLLGGNIDVESAGNGETVVTIRIPMGDSVPIS